MTSISSGDLPQPIQKQLSKKWKTLLNWMMDFWNLHQILNFLLEKDDSHTLCISEMKDCKRRGQKMS